MKRLKIIGVAAVMLAAMLPGAQPAAAAASSAAPRLGSCHQPQSY
jgi:hypothetical protein